MSYAGESKGKRKLVVTPEIGDSKEYLVPKGKHITVADGDFVEAGDPLTEGSPELHDILRTRGEKYLARYLVDEIQEVYRFQGVGIDDKHIEVIVRQMLKKVTVLDSGGTSFLVGEQVDKAEFKAENHKAIAEGRQPATAEPLVLGITQASLTTSSFISAASFQETTKVLTEASLKGKMDYLRGLKENVIVGRLILAGTGYREYVHGDITVPDQKERPTSSWKIWKRTPCWWIWASRPFPLLNIRATVIWRSPFFLCMADRPKDRMQHALPSRHRRPCLSCRPLSRRLPPCGWDRVVSSPMQQNVENPFPSFFL